MKICNSNVKCLLPGGKSLISIVSLSVFIIFLVGCASQEVAGKFSMSGHDAFEVIPVSNETGRAFNFDVAQEMTKQITSKLKDEGFNIANKPENATVIVKSSLTSYETQAGMANCTVKSVLTEKKTGEVLGEIVTVSTMTTGGLSQLGLETDRAILEVVAEDIVAQIERRIRVHK